MQPELKQMLKNDKEVVTQTIKKVSWWVIRFP